MLFWKTKGMSPDGFNEVKDKGKVEVQEQKNTTYSNAMYHQACCCVSLQTGLKLLRSCSVKRFHTFGLWHVSVSLMESCNHYLYVDNASLFFCELLQLHRFIHAHIIKNKVYRSTKLENETEHGLITLNCLISGKRAQRYGSNFV